MTQPITESHNPACDECRVKKLKCSRLRPRCGFCVKHGTVCNYSMRKPRVPLTRSYVSGLEQRIKSLERMLLAKTPDSNFDRIVTPHDTHSVDSQPQSSSTSRREERLADSQASILERSRPSSPEALPTGPSGFDWGTEEDTPAEQSDNRQNIQIGDEGVGYLGRFTNLALLRTLYEIGNRWKNAPIRQPICPTHLHLAGQYSDTIPWQALECSDSSESFAEFLIDAFFRHFHTTYPILHEATFRAQYSEVIPRPPPKAWSLLSRTVFAIGAWCTGCRILVGSEDEPVDCFQLFENIDLFRSGSLCMVQALALLGCYLHKQSKSNTASIYFGAAVKMAMSLGLHREFPNWKISLLEREMRRRVWWCLYVLESGHSMAMGRPVLLPSIGMMDIKLPLNVSEQSITARTTVQPQELPGLTIYSDLIAQAEFHSMINETYNHCIGHPDLPAKSLLDFNANIDAWMQSLPPHLQEDSPVNIASPRLNFASHHLLWRVRCLKIVLFFPNFVHLARRKNPEADLDQETIEKREAVCICVRYAHSIVTSIEHFFAKEVSNPLRDWYARFCLIQSALVLTIALHTNFPFLQDLELMLVSDFNKILVLLAKVSEYDPFAKGILHVMSQLSINPPHETLPGITNTSIGDEYWGELDDFLGGHFESWMQSL